MASKLTHVAAIIMKHLDIRRGINFDDLYNDVLNDWGSVSEGHVRRILNRLIQRGHVRQEYNFVDDLLYFAIPIRGTQGRKPR